MTILKLIALGSVVLAPGLFGQERRFEKRAIAYAQRLAVSQLDVNLPERRFAEWFKANVGSDAKISWEVNDCGEQTGRAADKGRDFPTCVEAIAELSKDRRLCIAVFIGTFKKGIWGRPGVYFAFIQDNGVTRDFMKLSDLPRLLDRRSK